MEPYKTPTQRGGYQRHKPKGQNGAYKTKTNSKKNSYGAATILPTYTHHSRRHDTHNREGLPGVDFFAPEGRVRTETSIHSREPLPSVRGPKQDMCNLKRQVPGGNPVADATPRCHCFSLVPPTLDALMRRLSRCRLAGRSVHTHTRGPGHLKRRNAKRPKFRLSLLRPGNRQPKTPTARNFGCHF